MRKREENNLDQEFRLALYEEMIFKWKPDGGNNQGKKLGGRGLGVFGQSRQKRIFGFL